MVFKHSECVLQVMPGHHKVLSVVMYQLLIIILAGVKGPMNGSTSLKLIHENYLLSMETYGICAQDKGIHVV